MKVLITPHVKVFLGTSYCSCVHTARNAKVTSTRNVNKKTDETEGERFYEAYLEHTRTSTMKLL